MIDLRAEETNMGLSVRFELLKLLDVKVRFKACLDNLRLKLLNPVVEAIIVCARRRPNPGMIDFRAEETNMGFSSRGVNKMI
jgi:hypothetical protein